MGLLLVACGGGGTAPAVTPPPQAAPTFTTPPAAQTVPLGQRATFTAVVAGNPAPTLQWIKDGTAIPGATTSTFQTPAATTADLGSKFVLGAVNALGTSYSPAATLTVTWPPAVTSQPQGQSVVEGLTATFTVGVDGSPAPGIQWQRNGQNLPGATAATYVTPVLTLQDSGSNYLAVLTNTVGGATSLPATLVVTPAPVPVSIQGQPQSQQAFVGHRLDLAVTAAGTAPISYQWQFNGAPIPGAVDATFTLPSVTPGDAGSYTVLVDNPAHQPLTSASAVVTVVDSPVPPSIQSQTQDLTITEGNQASFLVSAGGTAPLAYQWQRDQVDIPGATGSTYLIPAAVLADSGAQFRCRVTNAQGEAFSAPSTLTVLLSPNPPVIVGFSATPGTVVLGQSVTLAWGATAARSLAIDHGVGDVTGLSSKVVTPAQLGTTNYTLTAVNAAGSTLALAPVVVNSGPSYPLTVDLAQGVTGLPATGTTTHVQGTILNYAYGLAPGFQNLVVTIDGASVTPSGTIVMNRAHSLQATAFIRTLTMSPSATVGGTITPPSPFTVNFGGGCSFSFAPSSGYLLADVQVDGVSMGPIGTYDFSNITTDHHIHAVFVPAYLLAIHMGPGVTGTPGTTLTLPAGPVNYSYSLLPGYTALTVLRDNIVPLPSSGSVLMDADHHLSITASAILYPITCTATAGGTIQPTAPGGILNIAFGQIPTLTFVPDPGFGLSQLQLDGVPVALTAPNTYTFPAPVAAAHAIHAIFAPLP